MSAETAGDICHAYVTHLELVCCNDHNDDDGCEMNDDD
jgi:hypothetical protein